jgi:hypothetical protein
MGAIALTGIGTIYTKGATVDATSKTLIVSAHGRIVGGEFTKAYPTVVQFASPHYGMLKAFLTDAISGKVTASELALSGPKEPEHAFGYFQKDPPPSEIQLAVDSAGNMDVLTIDPAIPSTRLPNSPKLSDIIRQLKQQGFTYPSLLILACRVVKDLSTGDVIKGHTVRGAKHDSVAIHNQHQKDAVSIAQELKRKGLAK